MAVDSSLVPGRMTVPSSCALMPFSVSKLRDREGVSCDYVPVQLRPMCTEITVQIRLCCRDTSYLCEEAKALPEAVEAGGVLLVLVLQDAYDGVGLLRLLRQGLDGYGHQRHGDNLWSGATRLLSK